MTFQKKMNGPSVFLSGYIYNFFWCKSTKKAMSKCGFFVKLVVVLLSVLRIGPPLCATPPRRPFRNSIYAACPGTRHRSPQKTRLSASGIPVLKSSPGADDATILCDRGGGPPSAAPPTCAAGGTTSSKIVSYKISLKFQCI